MDIHRPRKVLFLLLALTAIAGQLSAENVYGSIAGTVADGSEPVIFHPEELVVVEYGDLGDFRSGMEIRLQIPSGLRNYQNSFAFLIFRNVRPTPETGEQSYRGSRAFMRLLPSRDSMFVRIPFAPGHDITGDALTDVLPVEVAPEDFPLLITVMPVMKGIPDAAFRESLAVSAVALLRNEGTLTVNLANPSGDPEETITVLIDGNPVEAGEPITLESGLHRVRVDSSSAPTVEKDIAINPGEEAVLDVELDYRAPEVIVTAPEGAGFLLDGEEMSVGNVPVTLEVTPGDHEVTYRIGDMEVVRTFNIRPGSKVSINLVVDISIVDFSDGGGNPYGAGDG